MIFRKQLRLGMRASILGLLLLLAGFSEAVCQPLRHAVESLEELTTDANDPTAILAELEIEEDYTPDEFGTQTEPNTIQIQPVLPVRPSALIPVQQLIRPTFKVNTI